MGIPICSSNSNRFTHLLLCILLFSLYPFPISSINVTQLLSPIFSDFNSLLTTTALAADLSARSPLTLLAVPNDRIRSSPSSALLPDVLRYHVLLDRLTPSDLRRLPPTGKLVTTLFQTTGRAIDNSGSVNISHDPASDTVTFRSLASNSSATLLSLNETLVVDGNVSVLPISSLLIPSSLDLMASETRPPLGLNITQELIDGHNFNVAAAMFTASGVVSEFGADMAGAGITLFAPTDTAFADLPSSVRFQSLTADQKAIVLKFHVLHSYYPLGTLESIVNPTYPTLATEQNGAGRFTVNISRLNGSVAIDTGLVLATITQTVFDQNPVAIFGVSKVLLPREYFGGSGIIPGAPPPDIAASSLDNAPGPSSHLQVPPLPGQTSGALRAFMACWCVIFCYVLLL
ncbi:Fasciclin-like arabinogalactan protein 4 [Striga hermonthica]|uniref:Fasciclin-like arabinogalactan protein 4 n=1 Tax=Striga hermonthica TaxID=68872 RepID=A0A9N7R4P9_STRHE|nr:Fasciclin-like arabinogalactan protein 4 [Striga hermonthica]